MGLCFSTRFEAGRALENGENPEIVFEGGNHMDVSRDPTEDGILQFPNLRNFSCNDRTEATGENPEIVFEGGNNMNVSGDATEDKFLKFDNLREFSFSDLRVATGFFDEDSLLGIVAFGSVYKGWIDMHSLTAAKPGTGMAIAVKKLMPRGTQGQQEWLAEIMHLGRLQLPNLMKLYGHCIENCDRLLVYEFMPNGSLDNHIFRGVSDFKPLSWYLRIKVSLGAAKGLTFLHNEAHVIHRL